MFKSVFRYAEPGFLTTQFVLVGLEQVAIAGSTLALALAGKNLQSPRAFLTCLIAFMILNQLPNFILIFIRRSETRGYVSMYGGFLRKQMLSQGGRPEAWAKHSQREKFLTAVGPEADSYITSVAYSYLDIYSYALSILLNTLALSLAIDGDFVLVFSSSMVLSYLAYHVCKPAIEKSVAFEQTEKLGLAAYVLKAWDNVLLNNRSVRERYRANLEQKIARTGDLAAASASWSSSMIFLVGFVSTLPVLAINLMIALRHPDDIALLAAMMITLPRQIAVLSSFRALFTQLANLKIFSLRLNTAIGGSLLEELDLQRLIQLPKLHVGDLSAESLSDLLTQLRSRKSGRVLITGANGAGKSSLLLTLNRLIESSFYLPAAPSLEIGEDFSQTSTGQKVLTHLQHIRDLDVDVLLLDEWDANLDPDNKDRISRELDNLATTRLIVEVRH
ncbi:MAG: hypothetical protein KF799_09995 [Bdellovibrionales bacterium]|nr:hypothetical protein [Bdellovibrionales bacterium]